MSKKRKKKGTVVSRNALLKQNGYRFGKKEKKKLIITVSIIVVLGIGAFVGWKYYNGIKEAEAQEAAKGKIIEQEAEKQLEDEFGNEVVKSSKYSIHMIKTKKGAATLIDCGEDEVLIDCGSGSVSGYISPFVEGNLEYVISTCKDDDYISGMAEIFMDYDVETMIYTEKGETKAWKTLDKYLNQLNQDNVKEAYFQNINLNNEITIALYNYKGSTICLVQDSSSSETKILIAGNTNAETIEKYQYYLERCNIVTLSDKALSSKEMTKALNKIMPLELIDVSSNVSKEAKNVCKNLNITLYSTQKSGTIIAKYDEGLDYNIDSDDQIDL